MQTLSGATTSDIINIINLSSHYGSKQLSQEIQCGTLLTQLKAVKCWDCEATSQQLSCLTTLEVEDSNTKSTQEPVNDQSRLHQKSFIDYRMPTESKKEKYPEKETVGMIHAHNTPFRPDFTPSNEGDD